MILSEESLEKTITQDNVFDVMDVAFKLSNAQNLRSACVEFVADHLGGLMKTEAWQRIVESKSEILEAVLEAKCSSS